MKCIALIKTINTDSLSTVKLQCRMLAKAVLARSAMHREMLFYFGFQKEP